MKKSNFRMTIVGDLGVSKLSVQALSLDNALEIMVSLGFDPDYIVSIKKS